MSIKDVRRLGPKEKVPLVSENAFLESSHGPAPEQ